MLNACHVFRQGRHLVVSASSAIDETKLRSLSLKPRRFVPDFRQLRTSALDSRTDPPLCPVHTLYALRNSEGELDHPSIEVLKRVRVGPEARCRRAGVAIECRGERVDVSLGSGGGLKSFDTLIEGELVAQVDREGILRRLETA